jgi:hypothetical protein
MTRPRRMTPFDAFREGLAMSMEMERAQREGRSPEPMRERRTIRVFRLKQKRLAARTPEER